MKIAQQNRGNLCIDIPGARMFKIVVMKFIAYYLQLYAVYYAAVVHNMCSHIPTTELLCITSGGSLQAKICMLANYMQ